MSECSAKAVRTSGWPDDRGKGTVWEERITFNCKAADTIAKCVLPLNGLLLKIFYERPNTSNDNLTSQLKIEDLYGNEVFPETVALAEALTTPYNVYEPLLGLCTVTLTFNEAVGVDADFIVTLRGI